MPDQEIPFTSVQEPAFVELPKVNSHDLSPVTMQRLGRGRPPGPSKKSFRAQKMQSWLQKKKHNFPSGEREIISS